MDQKKVMGTARRRVGIIRCPGVDSPVRGVPVRTMPRARAGRPQNTAAAMNTVVLTCQPKSRGREVRKPAATCRMRYTHRAMPIR